MRGRPSYHIVTGTVVASDGFVDVYAMPYRNRVQDEPTLLGQCERNQKPPLPGDVVSVPLQGQRGLIQFKKRLY